MLCKVQIETPLSCRLPGRIMLGYAYMKMVINPLIIFSLIYNMQLMSQFRMGVCGFIASLVLVDIIFQIMLAVNIYRNTANNLHVYNKYTKLMWMTSLLLGITYFICELTDRNIVTRYFYEIEDIVMNFILVMIICALIQTVIWHALKNSNNEADEQDRVFKLGFSVQIGFPSIEELTVAKVGEYDNMVEEVVTTNEKAKLTE